LILVLRIFFFVFKANAFELTRGLSIEGGFGTGIMLRPWIGRTAVLSEQIYPYYKINNFNQSSWGGGGTIGFKFHKNSCIKFEFNQTGYSKILSSDQNLSESLKVITKRHKISDENVEITVFNSKMLANLLTVGPLLGGRRISKEAQYVIKDTLNSIEYNIISFSDKYNAFYFGLNSAFLIPAPWRKELLVFGYNYMPIKKEYILSMAYRIISNYKNNNLAEGKEPLSGYLIFRYYYLNEVTFWLLGLNMGIEI
jgi:hypothetical protein